MSCKLLTHPSISTYIWAINLVLTKALWVICYPCHRNPVITWVFALSLLKFIISSIIFLL